MNTSPLSRNTTQPPTQVYRTSTRYPLSVRRPQVIRMRDLSPETKQRVMDEYYKSYDAMTGVRIAATLGGLITLFTLFLIYKSKCKTIRGTSKVAKKPVESVCEIPSESTSASSGREERQRRTQPSLEDIVIQIPSDGMDDGKWGRAMDDTSGEVGKVSDPQARSSRKDRPPLKSSAEGSRSLPCSPYRDKSTQQEQQPPPSMQAPPGDDKYLSKSSFPSDSLTSFSSKGSGPLPSTPPTPPPPPPPPKSTSRAKSRRRSTIRPGPRQTSVLAGPALMAAAAIAIPSSQQQRRRDVRGSTRLMSLSSQLSGRRKSTRGPRFLPPWD